jgi:thiol-disulfide isomerase/thioredoxin
MKKLVYLSIILLFTVACNRVENDYQACLKAEELYNQLGEKYDQAEKDGTLTPELQASLEKEDEKLFEKVKQAYTHFFKHHINTPFAQQIFSETKWRRRLNQDQLDAVVQRVTDPAFKETAVYQQAAERLHNMKTSVPGYPYKDIISETPSGAPVALSDYAGKGKYVLLDFWASWCPPCREEAPNLLRLYNEYKDNNFEIVSYSLDQNDAAWKNGIEQLGLTWVQMSDCAFWDSPAVLLYAVQSIPCTILIDPDGKIIERGLLGDNLSKKLEQLFR